MLSISLYYCAFASNFLFRVWQSRVRCFGGFASGYCSQRVCRICLLGFGHCLHTKALELEAPLEVNVRDVCALLHCGLVGVQPVLPVNQLYGVVQNCFLVGG